MTGHTKEPWVVGPVDDTVVTHVGADGVRYEIASVDGDYNQPDEWPTMEANARRIVDCVNALAGIPDPLAFVQASRGMLGALERLYDHSLPTGPVGDDACDEALRAIKAFRASTGEA